MPNRNINPLVSLIIPVYNSEAYLKETIESALNQTWENTEILIVDDGSNDRSLEIATMFTDNRIKIYSQENKGAAAARNYALRFAGGQYIQFLDSDDLLKEDKIELQIKLLEKSGYPEDVLVSGQWVRFRNKIDNLIGGVGPGAAAEMDFTPKDWLLLRPYNMMAIHAWLIPMSLAKLCGGWNEALTFDDDGDYFIRAVSQASEIKYCRGALVYYRTDYGRNTISSLNSCKKYESAYKVCLTYKEVLSKYEGSKSKEAVGDAFLTLAYKSYLKCPEVYKNCIQQAEIKYAKKIREHLGMKLELLNFILGWRVVKRLRKKFML